MYLLMGWVGLCHDWEVPVYLNDSVGVLIVLGGSTVEYTKSIKSVTCNWL